jgi:hypothetical protein
MLASDKRSIFLRTFVPYWRNKFYKIGQGTQLSKVKVFSWSYMIIYEQNKETSTSYQIIKMSQLEKNSILQI